MRCALYGRVSTEKQAERNGIPSQEEAKQGKVVSATSAPFGYRYNPRSETFEENPDKAHQVVRSAFYTYANEDLSLVALAARLG